MSADEKRHEPLDGPEPAPEPEDLPAADEIDALEVGELSREELENRFELAQAELERLQDQLLRRQAELINFRRRVQKERAELRGLAQVELLEDLLPVIDDFERAVETESEDARAYHEGMQLILRSVQGVLEKVGVERIDPRGEPFDPQFHEAIARQEVDDAPEGQVLDVYQTGYRLGDRLVRPATVIVAYRGDSNGAAESPGGAADAADAAATEDPDA
jgi:molecular chaperone GrpE